MKELIATPPRAPGRKQSVTAKAWISRSNVKACFISRVSLGKGKVFERSTGTNSRTTALKFNRAHLMELLNKRSKSKQPLTEQIPLFGESKS